MYKEMWLLVGLKKFYYFPKRQRGIIKYQR